MFGVTPVRGRTFLPQEDLPGGPKAALLGHDLWVTHFGSDPSLIGKPVVLGGTTYTVIGVLPASFHSDPPAEVFLPFQADPNSTNQGHIYLVAGRLKPGVSIEAAQANMKRAGEEFRQANPKWMDKTETVAVIPLADDLAGEVRLPLLILAGAVAFVLLIACANVANLLLARAAGRQKEIAIRTALGAGRWRLFRQLLTESVLLAGLSGLIGFAIGAWGVRLLLALSPGNLPRINDEQHVASAVTALDWRVLAFALGLSLAHRHSVRRVPSHAHLAPGRKRGLEGRRRTLRQRPAPQSRAQYSGGRRNGPGRDSAGRRRAHDSNFLRPPLRRSPASTPTTSSPCKLP